MFQIFGNLDLCNSYQFGESRSFNPKLPGCGWPKYCNKMSADCLLPDEDVLSENMVKILTSGNNLLF